MSMTLWGRSSLVWEDDAGPRAEDGVVAEQWRRFVMWRLGGEGAALVDEYEAYVPVRHVRVALEAAATSPFMDA